MLHFVIIKMLVFIYECQRYFAHDRKLSFGLDLNKSSPVRDNLRSNLAHDHKVKVQPAFIAFLLKIKFIPILIQ